MLGHQIPHLPPFAEFWHELGAIFGWLHGEHRTPTLLRADGDNLDPEWAPPRAMASWRGGAPIELIRFAGANRLKVEIDFSAESGHHGPSVIEPYALRRTNDGDFVLLAVADRTDSHSYPVDRITGVRVIDTSFVPRFLIEF